MGSATWLSGGESAAILNLDIKRWFYMIESSCCIEVEFLFTLVVWCNHITDSQDLEYV